MAGGSHTHISSRIRKFGIDTAHFTGQAGNAGKTSPHKKTAADILVLSPESTARSKTVQLRRALLEIGRLEICEECGSGPEYNLKPLTLEIDHVNGNFRDNRAYNLRFLCPNCHSQQKGTSVSWKARMVKMADTGDLKSSAQKA